MKAVSLFILLFINSGVFSQNGYVRQSISSGDTTYTYQSGQIYWKLYQGTKDAIIESTMPQDKTRQNVKYPIISRDYSGYDTRFVVAKSATEEFTIVFNSEARTVTYLFENYTVMYKGENVTFTLHD